MSASPGVNTTKGKPHVAPRGPTGAFKKLQLKPGKVASFLRYFEDDKNVPSASKSLYKRNSSYNNNQLSPPKQSQTGGAGALPRQQMAGQSENDAQPITGQTHSHVTGLKVSAPISSSYLDTIENQENVSHL